MPFLMLREKEIQDIMITLFDEEYIAKMYQRDLLSQGREEGLREGKQKGLQEGIEKSLRHLISATGWTLEQAMVSLGVPEIDRPTYREILKED